MAEARKAFKLATLEREELELMNDISNHENQLQTALNDDQRKELKLALKIARLELEINGYQIDLENATTDEERRRKEQHIETKEVLLNAQLQQKQTLNAQQMVVAQPERLKRIQALDEEVIDRIKTSVLCICEAENPENVIGTGLVWDFMDNEVLILTNYHTWSNEFSYCFPPPSPSPPPAPGTPKKKNKKKKRKQIGSDDEGEQDPAQLILRNDFGLSYPFTLTSDLFYRWNLDHDFAVLKLPRNQFHMPRIPVVLETHPTMFIHAFGYIGHTNQFTITGGEITGYIPECFTMNLFSAPGYSGAAIIADAYGRAVGYMGENLDASKRVNSQHQSYAFKFDVVMRATNRQNSPTSSPVKVEMKATSEPRKLVRRSNKRKKDF